MDTLDIQPAGKTREVTERDIDPADIPFGGSHHHHQLQHHHHQHPRHHHQHDRGKRLSYGESLSGSSTYSGSSSSHHSRTTDSGSESDSCFSEEEGDEAEAEAEEAGREPRRSYPLPYQRYTEGVVVTERPPYQTRQYGLEWVVQDRRRYKEEVRIQLGAPPTVIYSTTTQCFFNSKFRRYRDAVYLVPGAAASRSPARHSTTVVVFPKLPRRNVVSSLEHHPSQTVKWYRVAVQLEARDFVSVKLVQMA